MTVPPQVLPAVTAEAVAWVRSVPACTTVVTTSALVPMSKVVLASVLRVVVVIDAVGLDKLVASYDADGDGKLSKKELLTDVRLDGRPLGQVLLDPKAVDRQAVAKRLGALSPVVDGMMAKSP